MSNNALRNMKPILLCSLASLALLGLAEPSSAQVGGDNPTGPTGEFNGNVNTGGSYDPYTGNATRTVTDLVVAGAVGQYGLSLSRTWNSRDGCIWNHSYSWAVEDVIDLPAGQPIPYTVDFPDGRVETFAPPALGGAWRASLGTQERFKPLAGGLCYLLLPDGGKVEFSATSSSYYDGETHQTYYSYSFTATALIDPFGLRTTFTHNQDGSLTITEPTGRWLKLFFNANGIDHIQASDGRTVTYTYSTQIFPPGTIPYTVLSGVSYYGDASLVASYTYDNPYVGATNGFPLLKTCNDPMYAGPMKGISYTYATANNADGTAPVYGQILSEKHPNGTVVSTLAIIDSSTRTETRGDGPARTFTYAGGKLQSWTDFKNVSASKGYDAYGYVSALLDRRGYITNFTNNTYTGAVTQVQFPAVTSATPSPAPRGTVSTTYGWAACPDLNNRDANNPYHPYSITDEGGNTTIFLRDANKRVIEIDYPPQPGGGVEKFTYNTFGEVLTHQLTAGETESFVYDAAGNRIKYCDPDHAAACNTTPTGTPSAWYQYDSYGRLSGVTDVLGSTSGDSAHTTNFLYNGRGQLTTTTRPPDPANHGTRQTVVNAYNTDGTLTSRTVMIGETPTVNAVVSYTYDDYRRPLTVTTPLRYTGDPTARVTSFSYDRTQGTAADYTHTDGNVTRLTRASGNIVRSYYDENHRKTSEIASAADGATDAATTSYSYDNADNVTSVVAPNEQTGQTYAGKSTVTAYDQRNRVTSVTDALNNATTIQYDWGGRKKVITRANGQTVTFDSYDAMNRLLQQTVKQAPDPDAVTKYNYYASGLLSSMQDPRLVALGSSYNYSYTYDSTGRKLSVGYPPAVNNGTGSSESFTYDTQYSRPATFVNRDGKRQTYTYDLLGRPSGFNWNDSSPRTPTVTLGYDIASRLTTINNDNANITRAYYDDGLLKSETEAPVSGGSSNTVTYSYDPDANRATLLYPGSAYSFTYGYTGRDQLGSVSVISPLTSVDAYTYDVNGNLATRSPANSTTSTYTVDALDRVTNISHALVGTTRTLQYAYDNVNRRSWTRRDAGNGDVFGYDLNDAVTAVQLNIANPQSTGVGSQTIVYDANGNRTSFAAYGPTDTYAINNLNQYSSRTTSGSQTNATYDAKGNLWTFGTSTYLYDAQNRLTSATVSGSTTTFKYDALNRQISRTTGATSTYSVWDGWNLLEEYQGTNTVTAAYLSGPTGVIKDLLANKYYYQDGSGSTSHLASSSGALLEWYRYDLQGTPTFYNAANTDIGASANNVSYLFAGQRWVSGLGLYDLRNRFYSPDLGRFLQTDPIGFGAGDTNLYRYCAGDPVNRTDPSGLTWSGTIYRPEHKESPAQKEWGDRNFSIGGGVTGGATGFGFLSGPDGIPTGITSITTLNSFVGSGPGGFGQGGGGGGGRYGGSAGGGSASGGISGSNVPGYAVFYNGVSGRVIVAGGMPAMMFVAGELGFRPGELVFNGNGGVFSSTGTWTRPAPSVTTSPAGFSGNIVAAVGREFASYNMAPVADAFDTYSLLVAKGMTIPAVIPAAQSTAGYLGYALLTRNYQELGDFGTELLGWPGPPPTSGGGMLGAGWRAYARMMWNPLAYPGR